MLQVVLVLDTVLFLHKTVIVTKFKGKYKTQVLRDNQA